MTFHSAAEKTEANRKDALINYRRAAKGLFDESEILDLKHEDETTNCDRILRRLAEFTRLFKNFQVRVEPFDEVELQQIAAALTMPTLATYTEWTPADPADPDSPAKSYEREFDPPECGKIAALQKAVRDYCFEAADLAHRTKSATEKDWKRAFNTLDRDCIHRCVTFPACTSDDATQIASLLNDGADALRADILVFCRELKREIDGMIASLVANEERTLAKIRGNSNAAEVAALVNAHAIDTCDDLAQLIDKAITYGFHSDNDFYEEYDASEIGDNLREMVNLRFPDDPTVVNSCNKAIDGFMHEFDRDCQVYRGLLIQGLTEDALSVYEWLTRKDPTPDVVTKADLLAALKEVQSPQPSPPKDTDLSSEGQCPSEEKTVTLAVSPRLKKDFIKDVDFEKQTIYFKGREPMSNRPEMVIKKTKQNRLWNLLVRLLTQTKDKGWVTLSKDERNWHGNFRRTAPGARPRNIVDPTQHPVILGFHVFADKAPGDTGVTKIRLEKKYKEADFQECLKTYRIWRKIHPKER